MIHEISLIELSKVYSKFVKFPQNLVSKNRRWSSTNLPINKEQLVDFSTIPTMHFQKGLYDLPLKSHETYKTNILNLFGSLLNKTNYEKISDIMENEKDKFKFLHKELERIKENKTGVSSWLFDFWLQKYLTDRSPLPVNYNPMLLFPDNPNQSSSPAERATHLIVAALQFKRSLSSNILEPDIFNYNIEKMNRTTFAKILALLPSSLSYMLCYYYKMYPLDMSQYSRMFGCSRIPNKNCDKLEISSNSRHIMVLNKGNISIVEVLNSKGEIYSKEHIFGALNSILSDQQKDQFPIGYFTCGNRDEWATYRERLLRSPKNTSNIAKIDSALFGVCLDDSKSTSDEEYIKNVVCGNGHNRWFDKCFQIVVDPHGKAGLNFEHSWGDGYPILRLAEKMSKISLGHSNIDKSKIEGSCNVDKLGWELNTEIKKDLDSSMKLYNQLIGKVTFKCLQSENLSRSFLSTLPVKISPDSIAQLSFQIAFQRAFSRLPNVYEAGATIGFRHGRTETVRPVNKLSQECCEYFSFKNSNQKNINDIGKILDSYSSEHKNNIISAVGGNGIDRYFFVLSELAKKHNMDLEFFQNPQFKFHFKEFDLSTSTLMSDIIDVGAFGPPASKCIGLAYRIDKEKVGLLAAYYDRKYDQNELDAELYVEELEKTWKDIRNVLSGFRK